MNFNELSRESQSTPYPERKERFVKKILWTLIFLAILCGLTLWLFDIGLGWSNNTYAPEEIYMENEHFKIYDIQEGTALDLDNIGKGYIGIGYGDTTWPGIILLRKQDLAVVLDMVTAESLSSDGPSSRHVVKLQIGQETTFGGYRIKVVDIWSRGGLFRSSYSTRLAIGPEETSK